jgi:Asp-tRNA(Asn)/Glu-tRNA(Gln) amidotransferase A subunit family amidase
VSPVELTEAYLRRIDDYNPSLNAYITITREQALAAAREMEMEQRRRRWRGPLHGIPVALKDNIDTAGIPITAASGVLKDRVPAEDAELAGYDERDSSTIDAPVADYAQATGALTAKLRLGVRRAGSSRTSTPRSPQQWTQRSVCSASSRPAFATWTSRSRDR